METIHATEVKALAANLKGDVDVDVVAQDIAGKVVVDITVVGR